MSPSPASSKASPHSLRIVILAKAPVPGFVKTRLIPRLGAEGAARLARQLLGHAVQQAIAADVGAVELCVTPAPRTRDWHGIDFGGVNWTEQASGDLGARMAAIARRVTGDGESVLLIGTDCPALDCTQIRRAGAALADAEATMIPAADGGYVLLGLNHFDPLLFADVPWSTAAVAADTRLRIERLGWRLAELPALHDIDEADDLAHLPAAWIARLAG